MDRGSGVQGWMGRGGGGVEGLWVGVVGSGGGRDGRGPGMGG